jgi:hypothetical protein
MGADVPPEAKPVWSERLTMISVPWAQGSCGIVRFCALVVALKTWGDDMLIGGLWSWCSELWSDMG